MVRRRIFGQLEDHLKEKEVTLITGMRRTGKTTALNYLLDRVPHQNKVYLDLERIEYRQIFFGSSFSEMQAAIELIGFDFSKAGVIAIDEIQLVPEAVSFIKYYYDHHGTKFLLSGSSSFYLKNRISESLAGRKRAFELYPLDFIEFLQFKQANPEPLLKSCMQAYRPLVYSTYHSLYEEYLQFGGFPQVVLAEDPKKKRELLRDILNSYLELDIKILSDYSVIDDLFKLVRMLVGRTGNKLDYKKLGSLTGIRRQKVKDYIQLFRATYFVHLITPFSINPDRSIAVQPKVYLADTGLINQFGQVSSGALFENAIANHLMRLGEINYYQKKTGQEIDFILDQERAFEVKETPKPSDLKTLSRRADQLGLQQYDLIGRFPPDSNWKDFIWGGCVC